MIRRTLQPIEGSANHLGFNLPDPIPSFPLPLKSGDPEPAIDLQVLLNNVYDGASYDLAIDYNREPVPPLLETDRVWVDRLLREQKLRSRP